MNHLTKTPPCRSQTLPDNFHQIPRRDLLAQVVEEQSRALQLDALRSSHPVEVPIRRAKEAEPSPVELRRSTGARGVDEVSQ